MVHCAISATAFDVAFSQTGYPLVPSLLKLNTRNPFNIITRPLTDVCVHESQGCTPVVFYDKRVLTLAAIFVISDVCLSCGKMKKIIIIFVISVNDISYFSIGEN